MLSLPPAQLTSSGVYTASAGNYAQGVALAARQLNMPCHVIVPDTAPLVKTAAIAALGAHLLRVPYRYVRWRFLLLRQLISAADWFVEVC